jgi:threonine dehydrogenase-like Zn-dependent dehydrogenase
MPTSHYQDMFKLIESVDIKINKLVTERVTLEQASDVIVSMNQYSNIGISVVDRF